jgi:hypothetical protein
MEHMFVPVEISTREIFRMITCMERKENDSDGDIYEGLSSYHLGIGKMIR